MRARRRGPRSGISLLEVLAAVSVASIMLLAVGSFIGSAYTTSAKSRDRAYAQTKASQMLEEIVAFVPTTPTADIEDFDAEGLQFRLTTASVTPNSPLSGNPPRPGGSYYKFVREISVDPMTGDPHSRKVTVKIFYARRTGSPLKENAMPLAVATGIVRAARTASSGKQVIDVYALSIENLPHVYRNDANSDAQYIPSAREARKAFEASLSRIEAANDWLKFKLHYIQRFSIGRDDDYRPYMNDNKPIHGGTRDPLDSVYFYPGLIEGSTYYYNRNDIKGNLAVDLAGTVTNTTYSYPLADQFNHPVRFPGEFDSPQAHHPYGDDPPAPLIDANYGYSSGRSVSQLSLRQFLEDLLTDETGKYRNAMLVNLHGELFPALPLRNWADPAKVPEETSATNRERRVVTHPYKLNFDTNEPVSLLTHMYYDNGSYTPSGTGNDIDVFSGLSAAGDETRAAIIIRDIKPYVADWPLLGLGGTADKNDFKVSTVQRERMNAADAKTRYVKLDEWPASLATLVAGENAALRTVNHGGPHVTVHAGPKHAGHAATKPEHNDPGWGNDTDFDFVGTAGANDLVILASDLSFDARQTDSGAGLYGIKGTATAYDRDHTLYGRAYLPDPFLPFLSLSSGTTADGVTEARNTARIITQFKLKPSAVGLRFQVDTKLWDDDENAVHDRPEGTSTTYFYYGHAWDATKKLYWDSTKNRPSIPWTDQVQLVGDPRHNPYLDMRYYNKVNPYFSDFRRGKPMYAKDEVTNVAGDEAKNLDALNPLIPADYSGMAPPAEGAAFNAEIPDSADTWNGVKYNAPEYFRMWREAIMRNNMVFVSPMGEPVSLLGMGGEFKLNGTIDDGSTLSVSGKPWVTTTDAGDEADELMAGASYGAPWIVRSDAGVGRTWVGLPWLGELYPSFGHTALTGTIDWLSRGNLPAGRNNADRWIRETQQHLDDSIWSYATNKDNANDKKRILNNQGLVAFLNGSDASGGTPFNVDEGGTASAALVAGGTTASSGMHMSLPGTIPAKYSFALSGGATTPEWSVAPFTTKTALDWLVPSGAGLFYDHASATSTHASVGGILLKDVFTGTPNRIAVVVPGTLRPSSAAQVGTNLDVVHTAAVEAWLDATRADLGARNVKGLPRIRITEPAADSDLNNGNITVTWYGKWARADGRPYSAFYNNANTLPVTPANGEPLDVVYFLKYRQVNGGTWKTAEYGSSNTVNTTIGEPEYNGGVDPIKAVANPDTGTTYATKNTITWKANGLPTGPYVLRLEAYRTTDENARLKTMQGCYAYQEIDLVLH